jgi:hypothetical protein
MKKHIIIIASWLSLLLLGGTPAPARDRWAALSLIESGNNDAAIGRAGEVSRYQIKPLLWVKYCPQYPVTARANPQAALCAAQAIMRMHCLAFERRFHRPPTDFEYYVLWNAPAQIQKPGRAVSARANRFCNLVNS